MRVNLLALQEELAEIRSLYHLPPDTPELDVFAIAIGKVFVRTDCGLILAERVKSKTACEEHIRYLVRKNIVAEKNATHYYTVVKKGGEIIQKCLDFFDLNYNNQCMTTSIKEMLRTKLTQDSDIHLEQNPADYDLEFCELGLENQELASI